MKTRFLTLIAVILYSVSLFCGCTKSEPTAHTQAATETDLAENAAESQTESWEDALYRQQMNSISMLYYLAITAEQICSSGNSRLMLEDIYSALLNDINPGMIDEITQQHLRELREIVYSLITNRIKRERLSQLHDEDKAIALQNAIHEPLAVISASGTINWIRLANASVTSIADSYTNFQASMAELEREYLLSNWELEDEERDRVNQCKTSTFDYMVDIVQEYGLDGMQTLSDQDIKDFVSDCATENDYQKINNLVEEESKYYLLGNYWLELADAYFQTGEYRKCLDCVAKYDALTVAIYRTDRNYVQILPKAIVAAQNVYTGDEYVANIDHFAHRILENTDTDQWSIRYFAAQVYLDLYKRTNDTAYLEMAYTIAVNNVSTLLDQQYALNAAYLAEVEAVGAEEANLESLSVSERDLYDQFINARIEKRSTELPPLYQPLILNCDLLFALAEKLSVDAAEQSRIQNILHTNDTFLSLPVRDRYSFTNAAAGYCAEFRPLEQENQLIIPVNLLSEGCTISVNIKNGSQNRVYTDWTVTRVERRSGGLDSFYAYLSNNKLTAYEWAAGAEITIKIFNGDAYAPAVIRFKVSDYKDNFLIPDEIKLEPIQG